MFLEFYAAMFVFLTKEDWAILILEKSCKKHFVVTLKRDGFVFMN